MSLSVVENSIAYGTTGVNFIIPDWLIAWYKGSPGHSAHIGFNDWEPHLVYGKPPHQIHDHFQTPLNIEVSGHPCPKPLSYSMWLIKRAADHGSLVCDPFMGSGTTGVACAKLGRKFIGIEIEPKYFDIACKRIEQSYRQPDMFIKQPKAEQIPLGLKKPEPA